MRATILLIVGILGFAASCAHESNEAPLTPAEKERMIEAERARAAVSEDGQKGMSQRTGCTNSNSLTRFNARGTGFSGADGFDTRGCNNVGK